MITIAHAAPERILMADVLQHLGLFAPEEKPKEAVVRTMPARSGKKWPSYEQALQTAPLKRNGDGPDVSIAVGDSAGFPQSGASLLNRSRKADGTQHQGAERWRRIC